MTYGTTQGDSVSWEASLRAWNLARWKVSLRDWLASQHGQEDLEAGQRTWEVNLRVWNIARRPRRTV